MDKFNPCRLCPRECGVDRNQNTGYCKAPANIMAGRASLHMWEEPCISGENGSGTVFFSGCPLRCVYCQNNSISDGSTGKIITTDRLSEIFLELQEKGANNINLVTPTHYTASIADAIVISRKNGLKIPIVYNCSGYEKTETLELLEGLVNIYLVDFKYIRCEPAMKYSNAPDYPEVVKKAVHCMVSQVGSPAFRDDGIMEKGVIVRHLVLPSLIDDAKKIISYLYKTYKNNIFISIMNQYTPLADPEKYPELACKVTKQEYDDIINYTVELGVENAFVQEGETADESFIPVFDGYGL